MPSSGPRRWSFLGLALVLAACPTGTVVEEPGPDAAPWAADAAAHDASATAGPDATLADAASAGADGSAAGPDAGAWAGPDAAAPGPDAALAADDTRLALPPTVAGRVILAPITGYEMKTHCDGADDVRKCELPLYEPYDRDQIEWWYDLVEELAFARVPLVLLHGRGCTGATGDDGVGNMCPRLLRHFVKAVQDKGLADVIRVGMFDDTGAYKFARIQVDGLPADTHFDLADPTSWRFFWDLNMKPWFETIPASMLYKIDGRPVVAFWSLSSYFFSNQQGHASALLAWLRQQMIATFGLDPLFIVDATWPQTDTTVTPSIAQGVNDWFEPPVNSYTVRAWGGQSWGCVVPSYRDPNTFPGCGAACREVTRQDGATLRRGLNASRASKVALLEGFTNIVENAGLYRGAQWSAPNRYLGVMREFADLETATLRYEAEAADAHHDTTPGNGGGAYRTSGDLDVGGLADGTGWFVGWAEPGEWVEFRDVHLSCGTYRFNARVATAEAGSRVRLELDGRSLGSVAVPLTGSWDAYQVLRLGETQIPEGRHRLRFAFEAGHANLDWFFHRKLDGSCAQDRPLVSEGGCPPGLSSRGVYRTPTVSADVTGADFLDKPFPGAAMHFCHQGQDLSLAAGSCPAGYVQTSSLRGGLQGSSFTDSGGQVHSLSTEWLRICVRNGVSTFAKLGGCPAGATQTGLLFAPPSASATVVDVDNVSGQGTWAAICSTP